MATAEAVVYVCVVSEFTLPTLQACLDRRPAQVVLVASDKFQGTAERLKGLLDEKLPQSHVQILSKASAGDGLEGDDICANALWLNQHLRPLVGHWQTQGLQPVANVTGGTKAMTLALCSCFAWPQLDYQPINKPAQTVLVHSDGDRAIRFSATAVHGSVAAPIGPKDVARLYNSHVREEPPNSLCALPASGAIAQSIWDAQRARDAGLGALFKGLERVWTPERSTRAHGDRMSVDWLAFLAEQPSASHAQVRDWVQRLGVLAPDWFHADEAALTLPGLGAKQSGKDLRKWISGDWLEQLAGLWLEAGGIAPEEIARNLVASPDATRRSDSNREADLLIHHHNTTSLVEIKAGLPPGKSPSEMENQLSSLGSRFGKTRKALLLGPDLLQLLRAQQRAEALWYRCQASGVALLLERAHVIEFAHGHDPWREARKNAVVPEVFKSAAR